MSSMMRWDPNNRMISLRDMMDRLFEDSFVRPWGFMAPANMADLAIDMYETKDDLVVKAALPGVDPEDVELTISGDTLTLRGETKQEQESRDQDYIRRERRYGSFVRSVTLPSNLKVDQADAKFENGVLTLRIPKTEKSKPKSIKIQTKK